MNKRKLEVGDVKAVEFRENKKPGRKPICVIDGIVGFITPDYHGEFIEAESLWHVIIKEIHDTTLVVDPLQILKTKAENVKDKNEALQALTNKFKPKHKSGKTVQFAKSKKIKFGRR